jgi:Sec-independent protein secretion pathway component TatC
VAAFITPPDAFSQIALSVPLYLLYELSILICNRRHREVTK